MRSWWRAARTEERLRNLVTTGEISSPVLTDGEKKVAADLLPRGGHVFMGMGLSVVLGMTIGTWWNPCPLAMQMIRLIILVLIGLIVWKTVKIRNSPSRFVWIIGLAFAVTSLMAIVRGGGRWNSDMFNSENGEAKLVEVQGVLLDEPGLQVSERTSLDTFGHHQGNLVTRLELIDSGQVLSVRLPGTGPLPGAGDQVVIKGRIHAISPPKNPGERDRRSPSASGKLPGFLVVTDLRLIRHENEVRPWYSGWLRVRSIMRGQVRQAIDSLAGSDPVRRSLLFMLFLGERTEGSSELHRRFASCGLAHVLAISGLHLAILLGSTLAILWVLVPTPAVRSILAAAVLLGYASLLEPRTSIERAALTMSLMLLGRAFGASWRSGALFSLVVVMILWFDPSVLMLPGFQLSFTVTAGLSFLAGPCRTRWFGPPDILGRSRWSIIQSRLLDGFTSATVAWLIGMPIVLHHFSQFSPAAVPATLVASIPVLLLLGIGFPLIGALVTCPYLTIFAHDLVAPVADIVLGVAYVFEWMMPAWVVPRPFAVWGLITEAAVLLGLAGAIRLLRRIGWGIFAILMFTALLASWQGNPASPMMITALAVGNGSAVVIRGGHTVLMFDAGSSSVRMVGERIIVPALRSSGIRRIDAIIVSHANLDHVSGIPALLDAFEVDRVLCSEHMVMRAWKHPQGLASALLNSIHERQVPIQTIGRGDHCTIGELDLEVLHPDYSDDCRSINDESVVGLIRHRQSTNATFLVCGDAQDESLARLMKRYPDLQPCGMELPHHGSWRDIAVDFVNRVDPKFVLQSTGHGRYMLDRWKPIMNGRHRGVTSRDGALRLTLNDHPELETFIQKN